MRRGRRLCSRRIHMFVRSRGFPSRPALAGTRVEAYLAIGLRQADDPLAMPRLVQMMPLEQLVDGGTHMLAELAELLAAPGRVRRK